MEQNDEKWMKEKRRKGGERRRPGGGRPPFVERRKEKEGKIHLLWSLKRKRTYGKRKGWFSLVVEIWVVH